MRGIRGRSGANRNTRRTAMKFTKDVVCLLAVASLVGSGCGSGAAPAPELEVEGGSGDQNGGEGIFIDTRFAHYFAENMTGTNDPLTTGGPVVAQVSTPAGALPRPFAGESINC